MKKLFVLIAVCAFCFLSCTKDALKNHCDDEQETAANAVVLHAGDFQFVAKSGSGKAVIYRKESGALMLGLEGMSLSSNTHFKIMAATAKEATGVKIFSAAGLNGTVFYDLPASFDLSRYKYIIIQTEPSEEVVASAALE